MNATYRAIHNEQLKHCKNVFEWSEFSNETEPVCTNKCKEGLIKKEKFLGKNIRCCTCGEITDDHKLSDVSVTIRCHRVKRNMDRYCPNTPLIPRSECGTQGCN